MKTMQQTSLLILISLMLAASCKKDENETASPQEAKVLTDVSYGNEPAHKMDVYLPADRNDKTPVIVLLHGGGFIAGDKKEFTEQAVSLRDKGYVVLNVNYRLVDSTGALTIPVIHKVSAVKISDQLNDVDAAINFSLSKSAEWRMSSEKWGITGHSAGATLSLLYGYGSKNGAKRIKVTGNWAGATNFGFTDESEADSLDPRLVEIISRAVGHELKNENKLAYMAVSPFWLINSGSIPTLNIRPENNVVIGDDNSKEEYRKLTEQLNSKSVPNKLVEIANADHGFSNPGNWTTVINETDAFFGIYLK